MSQEYIRVYKSLSAEKQNIDQPLMEDFEDTLIKWKVTKSNASGAVTRDTSQAYRGNASVKLDTGTSTPLANDHIDIEKKIGAIKDNIITCSLRFLQTSVSGNLTLGLTPTLINRETGKKYVLGIRYAPSGANDIFQYQTAIGTWTTFATVSLGVSPNVWVNMEIVMDLNTGKYLYAIVNGQKYDLSGISPDVSTAGAGDACGAYVTAITAAAAAVQVYVDDIIIDKVK